MLDQGPFDGVHRMLPREGMPEYVRKMRDTYVITPNAPLYHREFHYYCLEEWYEQGLSRDADLKEVFHYDEEARFIMGELGTCEAALCPEFEESVIEDRGEHEVICDSVGRHVLCFKGRRSGFMPEYVDHPVKDRRSWEENIKWRLDPESPERYANLDERMTEAKKHAANGEMIVQILVGGYMYLRSLMGPADLLYVFYDNPELVRDCMETWFRLADRVIATHQRYVTLDEIFFSEDICYNNGSLISPDMIREFLVPYYQQLVANVRSRQIDRSRHLYVQVDSDGHVDPVIPLYQEAIGMDVMSPFEVASGCDVVELGRKYPDLVITGGIDKRVLAQGKIEIDRMVERVLPPMRKRGGYIPTCDHGVPAEVTLDNYIHYRKRCVELGG